MIPVLLNIFDTRASVMSLLKGIVEREVAQAGAPHERLHESTFVDIHSFI